MREVYRKCGWARREILMNSVLRKAPWPPRTVRRSEQCGEQHKAETVKDYFGGAGVPEGGGGVVCAGAAG